MTNKQFNFLTTLINTNSYVQEFFAVSNEVRIRVDEVNNSLIFSTNIKPNCLIFKLDEDKKKKK